MLEIPSHIKAEIRRALDPLSSNWCEFNVKGSDHFKKITPNDISSDKYKKLLDAYDIDIEKVCRRMNETIAEERKKNEREVWKVRIIKF